MAVKPNFVVTAPAGTVFVFITSALMVDMLVPPPPPEEVAWPCRVKLPLAVGKVLLALPKKLTTKALLVRVVIAVLGLAVEPEFVATTSTAPLPDVPVLFAFMKGRRTAVDLALPGTVIAMEQLVNLLVV